MNSYNIGYVPSKESDATKELYHATASWRDFVQSIRDSQQPGQELERLIVHSSATIDALCADVQASKIQFGVAAIEDINGIINSTVICVENHRETVKVVDEIVVKDHKSEVVRYWVLGREEFGRIPEKAYKTCVLLKNLTMQIGTLAHAITTFAENKISLEMITSIPVMHGRSGKLIFVIELGAHAMDTNFDSAISIIESNQDLNAEVVVLGSYERYAQQ